MNKRKWNIFYAENKEPCDSCRLLIGTTPKYYNSKTYSKKEAINYINIANHNPCISMIIREIS